MVERESKTEVILKVLKRSNFVTIIQLAKLTGLNRATVSKYLMSMEAVGKVHCQQVGRAKLYAVTEEVVKQ
jgi:predicted transcriptional regulator